MGGKANLLNPRELAGLYAESRSFRDTTDQAMHHIERELARLHDPIYQRGLSGEDAKLVKQTLHNVNEAIGEVKSVLNETNAFIESRLSGIAYLGNQDQSRTSDRRISGADRRVHWMLKK